MTTTKKLGRWPISAAAVITAIVVATGCGRKEQTSPPASASPEGASAQAPLHYKLAALVPETGNLAFIGQPIRSALALAEDDSKARLAAAGITVETIFADTQGTPATAVSQFRRVADMDQIHGLITTLSGVIGAISPMAKNRDILFMAVTPDPSFLAVTPGGLRVMSSLGGDRLASLIHERGYKKVLLFHSTDSATMYEVTKVMVPALNSKGTQVTIDTFDVGKRDFKDLAAKHGGDSWDCVVIHGFGSEQPYVAEACSAHPNLKSAPMLLSLGVLDTKPDLRPRLAGAEFYAPAFLDGTSPAYDEFAKRFSTRFPGVTLSQSAVYSYDAYVLLVEALLKGRSLKSDVIKRQLQTSTKALTQSYCFDAHGDFHPDMSLLRVMPDGSFAPSAR